MYLLLWCETESTHTILGAFESIELAQEALVYVLGVDSGYGCYTIMNVDNVKYGDIESFKSKFDESGSIS